MQSDLEGWNAEKNSFGRKELQSYRQQLLDELECDSVPQCFRPPSNKFWKSMEVSFLQRIHDIFFALKDGKIVDPKELYVSTALYL